MNKAALVVVLALGIAIGGLLQLPAIWHANAQSASGVVIARASSQQISKGAKTIFASTAKCPPGTLVLGGGHSVVHGNGASLHYTDWVKVFQSVPLADYTGWYVRGWVLADDAAVYQQAIAVCAKM